MPIIHRFEKSAKMSGRMMRYPQTLGAKVMMFPWKYHWQNGRLLRYYAYSLLICAPLFWKITSSSKNSYVNFYNVPVIFVSLQSTHPAMLICGRTFARRETVSFIVDFSRKITYFSNFRYTF